MAGTGKSTVSCTFSEWLEKQGSHGMVNLGATFFFKRGQGERSNASRFFSTIVRDLLLKTPALEILITEVITSDPDIFEKALGEQFKKLILLPLQRVQASPTVCSTLVLIVDALDECETNSRTGLGTSDIHILLDLLPQISQITAVRLKVLLTSRPGLPIQLQFDRMLAEAYQNVRLHEIPQTTVDIAVFLRDELSRIWENYNTSHSSAAPLDDTWPAENVLQRLVSITSPLFIAASTACLYIGDQNFIPSRRLQTFLDFHQNGMLGAMGHLEKTYLTVISQIFDDQSEEDEFYARFRATVGAVVILAEPLSTSSLAALLDMSQEQEVDFHCLSGLPAVLQVLPDPDPVRILHKSFGDFLLSEKMRTRPFGIDGPAMHRTLAMNCLRLLSSPTGLRENLCNLTYPGEKRREIEKSRVNSCMPPPIQYACRYWVHHVEHSSIQLCDNDQVHQFLKRHFLHWLEALSFIELLDEVVGCMAKLQKQLSVSQAVHLFEYIPKLT